MLNKTATISHQKTIKPHKRPHTNTLLINNLHVEADNKKILNGINLKIQTGEIHAIMGPNGSGKSTLLKTIMGHPKYKVPRGIITINNTDISNMPPDKRAKLGLFLGFQNPTEIPGTSLFSLLKQVKKADPSKLFKLLNQHTEKLKVDKSIIKNAINENLSGGEKKISEIIQMRTIKPKFAMLDEIDSGLDIDSLKIVAENIIETFKRSRPAILLITHYPKILEYIKPDYIHIIQKGEIIKSGNISILKELNQNGYKHFSP